MKHHHTNQYFLLSSFEIAFSRLSTINNIPNFRTNSINTTSSVTSRMEPQHDDQIKRRFINLCPLDGIRGLCSVVIVVGHFFTFWAPRIDSTTPFPAFSPEYLSAVTLFFIISGFTLVQVYDRDSEDPSSPTPLQTMSEKRLFYRKRIARLFPLYLLGLFIALGPLIVYKSLGEIIANVVIDLLGIQSLIVISGNEWNGPLWTVSAFAFCYIFFPAMLRHARQFRYTSLRRKVMLITLFSFILCAATTVLAPGLLIVIHILAPVRFMHFGVGVYAGYMAKRWSPTWSPTIIAELLTFFYAIIMGASIAIGVVTEDFWAYIAFSYNIEFSLPFFQVMWILALTSPDCGGLTKRFLSTRPMRFLGDISYAIYCLHFPIFNWCAWAVEGNGVNKDAVPPHKQEDYDLDGYFYFDPWAIVPILLVVIGISALAHKILEAPARAAISKSARTKDITTTPQNA